MKRKKINASTNYLERIPMPREGLKWEQATDKTVTLAVENTGFFNRAAQRLLKKPRVSYIHLDEIGSFVWPLMDGRKNIIELGAAVEEHFGEKAYPLYERLAEFFRILDSYGFTEWK